MTYQHVRLSTFGLCMEEFQLLSEAATLSRVRGCLWFQHDACQDVSLPHVSVQELVSVGIALTKKLKCARLVRIHLRVACCRQSAVGRRRCTKVVSCWQVCGSCFISEIIHGAQPHGIQWKSWLWQGHRGSFSSSERCVAGKHCYCAQGAEGIFGEIFLVKNLEHNSGSQWSAQASLSQHSLAWHDLDLAFRNLGPSPPEWLLSPSAPPNPPSPRRLWPGQAGQSLTSTSCLPSPSPEAAKAW